MAVQSGRSLSRMYLAAASNLLRCNSHFSPMPQIVAEDLLHPALAADKVCGHGCDGAQVFVGLNGKDDRIHQVDVCVGLRFFGAQQCLKLIDGSLITKSRYSHNKGRVGGFENLAQVDDSVLQVCKRPIPPERMERAGTESCADNPSAAGRHIGPSASERSLDAGMLCRNENIDERAVHHLFRCLTVLRGIPVDDPEMFEKRHQVGRGRPCLELNVPHKSCRFEPASGFVSLCGFLGYFSHSKAQCDLVDNPRQGARI
jgi:hypothetical protein